VTEPAPKQSNQFAVGLLPHCACRTASPNRDVEWISNHPTEAASLSHQAIAKIDNPYKRIELFLDAEIDYVLTGG
jgi:hypothetical protein